MSNQTASNAQQKIPFVDYWPPFEWIVYEMGRLVTIIFLLIILKPLWTVAKRRPILLILFSKSILSLIDVVGTLLARTANRIVVGPLETTLFIWRLQNKLMHDMLEFAILLHILALAINRAHCIFWPLHYKGWITKRKIVEQCIFLWILGFLIAIAIHVFAYFINAYQGGAGIILIALFFYLIVGAKSAWKKYYSTSSAHSAIEKDFNKISVVFISSLLPSFMFFVAQTIALNFRYDTQLIQTFTGPFTYCADEIVLIILKAEFRQQIKKFMSPIYCMKQSNEVVVLKNVKILPTNGMMQPSSLTNNNLAKIQ